ncbi:BatD family protein [Tenacibaculum sp. ZS6-P6]|uniref:BatD family protein n=1 Tax=Tenacibaculum sp. ZS6-P6 TaxID=3447503 RepID=UPI003F98DE46
MKLKFITYILTLVSLTVFAQDAKLTATVSKNKLGVNQRLRVEFAINKQGADNFSPPSFKNFKIVGGPSQSVSQSWINGKSTFSQSYTYIIQPLRKGEFNLPSASIQLNGITLKSEPVKIIVTAAVKTPKNPNDPDYIAEQNIHLVAEVSKGKPYVGEGIYVEYRLYFSNNVGIYDNAITESPQYIGFWNQEIKNNNYDFKTAMYNGEQYRYAVLHKALLIPTKSGNLTIDPMKMDILVAVPTGRADFFGNPITRRVRKQYASAKKIIKAKALPEEGKPDSFTGAVGNFEYTLTSNKNTLKANESSELKVEVSGLGNLKLFELPKVETPKELEVYQPERKENVKISTSGLKGSVTDTYTVVPQYKGKYKIPSTEFSYFNPKDNKYHTISTDDLFVNVTEGKELVSTTENQVRKQDVQVTGNNFRFIQTSTSLGVIDTSKFFKSIPFYFLLLLPLITIPFAIFIGKKKNKRDADILGNKQRKADKLAKKYLSEASQQLGNKEEFYEALERALHNYLKAKLNVETSDISKEKITELLDNRKVQISIIDDFIDVLKQCDFARYTPITNTQMNEEYNKAKQVITSLDRQL